MKLAKGKDNIGTKMKPKRYDFDVPSISHESGNRIPITNPLAKISQYMCATLKIRRIDIATGNNVIDLVKTGA